MLKNRIQEFLQERSLSVYAFWKKTGLAQRTAYDLNNDPTYVPGGDVLAKICEAFDCQPGELIYWDVGSKKIGRTYTYPPKTHRQTHTRGATI